MTAEPPFIPTVWKILPAAEDERGAHDRLPAADRDLQIDLFPLEENAAAERGGVEIVACCAFHLFGEEELCIEFLRKFCVAVAAVDRALPLHVPQKQLCKRGVCGNCWRGGAFPQIEDVALALFEHGRVQNRKEKERARRNERNAQQIADHPEKSSHEKTPPREFERMFDTFLKFYT